MNKYLVKMVVERENLFVPLLFTKKQILVMRQYLCSQRLSSADKKALYTSISKKLNALAVLTSSQELIIQGAEKMLPERVDEAKKILAEYAKTYQKIFVSGSFLFAKEYNDIDIFVIREKGYREVSEGKKHVIFLTENRLCRPIFQSAAMVSVSNFVIPQKLMKKMPALAELMSTYHEAVIELLNKDVKPEAKRRLIFDYYLFCKNQVLDPITLKDLLESTDVEELGCMLKALCMKLFSKNYLYSVIHEYIRTLKKSVKHILPNVHLIEFIKTYEELIYGSQRSAV